MTEHKPKHQFNAAIFIFSVLLMGFTAQLLTSYSGSSYHSQYTYRTQNNYYGNSYGNYPYYGTYQYYRSPSMMPSTSCNSILGCRTNSDSFIYVRSALDYTYYTHPELLEPRYMNNHQRYVRGTGAQMFWY